MRGTLSEAFLTAFSSSGPSINFARLVEKADQPSLQKGLVLIKYGLPVQHDWPKEYRMTLTDSPVHKLVLVCKHRSKHKPQAQCPQSPARTVPPSQQHGPLMSAICVVVYRYTLGTFIEEYTTFRM